jgi:uncharacterized protein
MKEILCITPSWDDMAKYAKKTAEKIILNNYRPDYIIAIARGGVVPARLLCDHLYIKSFLSIKVDHWGVTATADGKAKLSQGLDLSLEGKKVLLVDDITDTGQSIELARDHILKLKPKEVKTATLFHLNHSNYEPDFYSINRDWAWVIFPWNYWEDLVNLSKQILDEYPDSNAEDLKLSFEKYFKIDVPVVHLNETLQKIKYLDQVQ